MNNQNTWWTMAYYGKFMLLHFFDCSSLEYVNVHIQVSIPDSYTLINCLSCQNKEICGVQPHLGQRILGSKSHHDQTKKKQT